MALSRPTIPVQAGTFTHASRKDTYLLTNRASELAQRLVSSYHWSRKSHLEANHQLRVLIRWFAMEAVWMLNKNDDERLIHAVEKLPRGRVGCDSVTLWRSCFVSNRSHVEEVVREAVAGDELRRVPERGRHV
jgi:hypothetical protein